jgi:hypothetical protein
MRVVATTRASAGLDAAVEGWENGLDPVPERVDKIKVMFGEVLGGGRRRIGFGVGREVVSSRWLPGVHDAAHPGPRTSG